MVSLGQQASYSLLAIPCAPLSYGDKPVHPSVRRQVLGAERSVDLKCQLIMEKRVLCGLRALNILAASIFRLCFGLIPGKAASAAGHQRCQTATGCCGDREGGIRRLRERLSRWKFRPDAGVTRAEIRGDGG